MFDFSLEYELPDLSGFNTKLAESEQKILDESARAVIQNVVDNILAGQNIDGGSHPTLSPFTIKKKGHAHPLIDTGLLSDISTYEFQDGVVTIKSVTSNRSSLFRDSPRDEVAAELEDRGFLFFGISKEAEDQVLEIFEKEVEVIIDDF